MNHQERRLTRNEVGSIVKMLSLTSDHEYNCSECLQHVGEYAEGQLANQPLSGVILSVEQHMAMCPECREEYLALIKILKAEQ